MKEKGLRFHVERLTDPDQDHAAAFNAWGNDPELVKFMRPSRNQHELDQPVRVTVEDLRERVKHHPIYMIYADGTLVGEMNYQIDPPHLYRKVPGTAWIGIVIGEKSARGKGIGTRAVRYLEKRIWEAGCRRIELGVFEFNRRAHRLYLKLGYREIGRIEDFTYWKGTMWQDIRMEKLLLQSSG